MIRAGRLRHLVAIRRATLVDDGHGAQEAVWGDVYPRVPAEVSSQNGREAVIANSLQGVSLFRITTRFGINVRTTDQVRLADGRDLNIRSVEDPTGRGVELVIFADTASAQG